MTMSKLDLVLIRAALRDEHITLVADIQKEQGKLHIYTEANPDTLDLTDEWLHEGKFRPHWIVPEEAQQYISSASCAITDILLPRLAAGGWAFESYRPDRLIKPVLESLHHFLLTRLSEPEAHLALYNVTDPLNVSPDSIPKGYVQLCGGRLVQLRSNARRPPHIRHLHKYLDTPLQEHKRFHFRDKKGFLGLEAASLFEFLQILTNLPIAILEYHRARGAFANLAEDALGDGVLATHLSVSSPIGNWLIRHYVRLFCNACLPNTPSYTHCIDGIGYMDNQLRKYLQYIH
jgi:hypothetical protein